MNYIEVFRHIKTVRAKIAVDLVTAVVHGKANQCVVIGPAFADLRGKLCKSGNVCSQLCNGTL